MTSMLFATIVHAALLAAGVEATPVSSETYTAARQIVTETGKPLVVMVGTDWCAPCQTMKKNILPRVQEGGALRRVVFAIVNPDRDRDLAERLTGGGPIPQLVMFRKKGDGWVRKKLVGGQSVETVEKFIKNGVADDNNNQDSLPTPAEKSEKSAPSSDRMRVQRHISNDDEATRPG